MKKLLLFISVLSFSTLAIANEKKTNASTSYSSFLAQAIHVTSQSWCGSIAKYDYTPQDGMTEQQIDSEIALINWVISNNTCPPVYYI